MGVFHASLQECHAKYPHVVSVSTARSWLVKLSWKNNQNFVVFKINLNLNTFILKKKENELQKWKLAKEVTEICWVSKVTSTILNKEQICPIKTNLHQCFTKRFFHDACNTTECSHHLTFQFCFNWLTQLLGWFCCYIFCWKRCYY